MIKRFSVAALALTMALAGCDKLKDAMSAHSNVAAKAAGQELTVASLADLMGKSKAPLTKDVANAIVDAWTDYHLAAEAAANNDSLADPALDDRAMWSAIDGLKARKWYEIVSKTWQSPDSAAAEAIYNNGQVLAASHILLMTQGKSDSEKAAIKRKADAIRAQLTSANFSAMAAKNSEDPGSKVKGGSLGTFPRGAMVPQFEQALLATKPGEISPVFETQYGYHIIRRPTFPEVSSDVIQASRSVGMQAAESTYLATLERIHEVKIKPGTSATVRAVVEDPRGHMDDKTVLGTTDLGNFTGGKLARWVTTIPPQAQIAQRIKTAPDSLLPGFVKNFIRNELVIHSADSAKLGPTPQELADIRKVIPSALTAVWTALGVNPGTLSATAKSKSDRAKVAHQKVEQFVRDLLDQKTQFVEVTQPVEAALREKYDNDSNPDAVARALAGAATVRLQADSARTAKQPPTAVPVPNRDTAKK